MVHDSQPLDFGAWRFTSEKISTLHIPWIAAATAILRPRFAYALILPSPYVLHCSAFNTYFSTGACEETSTLIDST